MSLHARPGSAHSDDEALALVPPRPFFLAPNARNTDDGPDTASDSDHDPSPPSPPSAFAAPRTPRSRRRRSQLAVSAQPGSDHDDQSAPPSSYTFPFQAYPGNPDPLPPRVPRKTSAESIRTVARPVRTPRIDQLGDAPGPEGLPLPHPPFLSNAPYRSSLGSLSNTTVHRSSPAPASDAVSPAIPRTGSATFRTPFLSPASRPSSTWLPPTPNSGVLFNAPSNANSSTALPLPPIQKKPMPSTRLREKLTDDDKPWLALKPDKLERASKWLTFALFFIGVIVAVFLIFRGTQTVHLLQNNQLCIVLDDDFTASTLDTNSWSYDIELGGFGNGEFEMTTNSQTNVYLANGELYIMPTLTSDSIPGGYNSVMDNATYTLDGCTANGAVTDHGAYVLPLFLKRQDTSNGNGTTGNTTDNGGGTITGGTNSTNSTTSSTNSTTSTNSTSSGANACTAQSSAQAGTVINPIMSGRINTRGKKYIKYGKVEVRAKLPQGDWLWPAIWMLPEGNDSSSSQGTGVYGAWPVSGEIDIIEARGNLPSYAAQGSNYVRSTLNYGPFPSGSTPISVGSSSVYTLLQSLYGWVSTKRGNFASDFHVYGMEWTGSWMRFYTDNRLQAMINLDISSKNTDSYFFNVGDFPTVAKNLSSGNYIEVQDPWSTAYGGTAAAPFDQQFYLVIDLAAGGTSGWFPDSVGGKPWYDGSATAMREFASAQSTWSATWPSSANNRAFRIDYVKMWQLC